MKRVLLAGVALLAGCGAAPLAPAPTAASPRPLTGIAAGASTVRVARVIDGDTVLLTTGATVRLAGIDTPERGQCGYAEATANLRALTSGAAITTRRAGTSDRDRHGRYVRYLYAKGIDTGFAQIRAGLAIARYDSRTGYPAHPLQAAYIKADAAKRNPYCPIP